MQGASQHNKAAAWSRWERSRLCKVGDWTLRHSTQCVSHVQYSLHDQEDQASKSTGMVVPVGGGHL